MNDLAKTQIEGTYQIEVHTPMGIEEGTLQLQINDNQLSGSITNKKGTTEFTEGQVINNEVQFESKIKTPMGRLKAKVSGTIKDSKFIGTAKLPLGTAKINGTKIS